MAGKWASVKCLGELDNVHLTLILYLTEVQEPKEQLQSVTHLMPTSTAISVFQDLSLRLTLPGTRNEPAGAVV